MNKITEEFETCWKAAGRHLISRVDNLNLRLLRDELVPPFLEHMAFIIGNQLFMINILPDDPNIQLPTSRDSCIEIAERANAVPCFMRMKKVKGQWVPVDSEWGLTSEIHHTPLDPVSLITEEKIEISDWELHDFATQIVRNEILEEGGVINSWCSDPNIYPSMFFIDKDGEKRFVIVTASRYPCDPGMDRAGNENISYERIGKIMRLIKTSNAEASGFIAMMSVASADDAFDPDIEPALPLWRGHGYYLNYGGLKSID